MSARRPLHPVQHLRRLTREVAATMFDLNFHSLNSMKKAQLSSIYGYELCCIGEEAMTAMLKLFGMSGVNYRSAFRMKITI